MKKSVALICIFALAFTFAACSKDKTSSENGIGYQMYEKGNGKIIKLLLSPYGDKEHLLTGEVRENYVSVTSDGNFAFSDLDFISENEKVAKIKYVSTPLDGCVYYSIEGVRYGTTYVYIQSKDGSVRSEKIKVVVDKETIATTTTVFLRSYSYSKSSTEESDDTLSNTELTTSDRDNTSLTERTSESATVTDPHSITHTGTTSGTVTHSASSQTTEVTKKTTTRRRYR